MPAGQFHGFVGRLAEREITDQPAKQLPAGELSEGDVMEIEAGDRGLALEKSTV